MGRPLAPSTLSRPAATGRPGQPNGARVNGSVSSRIASQAPVARAGRAEARMHEATLRSRAHGDASASRGMPRPGDPAAELKRRRANVLFVLVLTNVCAGFLAATTDSKAMVYVFALAMLALGGYVYLLVTLNQREMYARGYDEDVYNSAPAPRRAPARRGRYDYADVDDYDYSGYDRPARQPAARQRQAVQPPARRQPEQPQNQYGELPGSGVSGRISYGRGPATRQPAARDPFAVPAPRRSEPRDPYGRDGVGWESAGRDPGRRAPARNGRHATGQQQAVRRQQSVRGYYSQAG